MGLRTIIVSVFVALVGLSSAPVSAMPGECVDIEALLSITLNGEGLDQAQRLWLLANGPLLVSSCSSGACSLPELPPPPRCGVEDGEEGRCHELLRSEEGSESFAGRLLDDRDRPGLPFISLGPACFTSPAQCSGLPPLDKDPTTSVRPLPDLREAGGGAHLTALAWVTSAPDHAGVGPSVGVPDELEHPPRTRS